MPPQDDLSDDYVAQLLAKDAQAVASRHSLYGLQGSLPRRTTNNAPKANTRFLKSIIKETDNHNAALSAKESQESRTRLNVLKRGRGADISYEQDLGRLKGDLGYDRPKRRRLEENEESEGDRRRNERRDQEYRRGRHRDKDRRSRHYGRQKCNHSEDDAERPAQHRRHRHRRGRNSSSVEPHQHRASRSRSRSPGSDRHPSYSHHHRSRRRQATSLSEVHEGKEKRISSLHKSSAKNLDNPSVLLPGGRSRSSSHTSQSDPLEAIIGPPPPPPQPKIKSRGRGTMTALSTSAIDTHFTSNYNPANDAHPDPEVEADDWDQALEALRDRQKWQQQGAERLKAAGFSEEEVAKWVKGKKGGQAQERGEEDVRWRGRGEGREWDRGKIVTDEGVETGAEWGRLKGS